MPRLEQAAIDAIGTSYAGLTVLSRTGAIEAAAGIAFTDVQPPGSTMKIVTATAALQAGIVKLTTEFPYESSITLDGYKMQNAAGETCGGTLLNAFATSCDTVFAPVGAEVGAKRLVTMAQRFGFDEPTGIPSAIESTIPSARTIGDSVAVGSSAIGQGRVQASTLELADIAATIADGGKRPLPRILAREKPRYVRVTTPKVAEEVQQMMEAVVSFGTGTTAQIPGVTVAGKTGTAELGSTVNQADNKQLTDSWFVGYAPAGLGEGGIGRAVPKLRLRCGRRGACRQAGARGSARGYRLARRPFTRGRARPATAGQPPGRRSSASAAGSRTPSCRRSNRTRRAPGGAVAGGCVQRLAPSSWAADVAPSTRTD